MVDRERVQAASLKTPRFTALTFPVEGRVWVAVSAPAVVMIRRVLAIAIMIRVREPIFLNAIF